MPNMRSGLTAFAFWSLLLLPLVLSPGLGLLTPYLGLVVIVPVFVVTLVRGDFPQAYSTYEARAFAFVFVVLAILFVITADSVSDALRAFNFSVLALYGPIAMFLRRQAGRIVPERVPQLALLGVALGLVIVVVSATLHPWSYLGSERPTGPNIGPIVLSNALLALGFVSLGGVLLWRDIRSWIYLLGPVAAILATILTASRGPLLGVPFALAAGLLFIWRDRFANSARRALVGLVAVVVAGAAGLLALLLVRGGSLLAMVERMLGGSGVTDEAARQRLVLYRAGWTAFLESPWVGHGWGNIMDAVRPLLAAGDAGLANLPQLHNDVLNFAVGGGVIGVLTYLVIISAPLIGALRSPHDGLRSFRIYGATGLTIVYIGGGLTDLMFGFEFHTYLFIMLTAILLELCQDRTQLDASVSPAGSSRAASPPSRP